MHKPRAIHTIRYLQKEPIKNLAAVRAAYAWLGVDDPQIQYHGNDANTVTHFSVYQNNKIAWWNRYIRHNALLQIIAEIRENHYDYGC